MESMTVLPILECPDTVIRCIWDKLDFADLCRLRLTSAGLNGLTNPFLKKLAYLRLEIMEDGPLTFGSAMDMSLDLGLPIQVLRIQSNSDKLYMDLHIEDFQKFCGAGVKKLVISEYYLQSPIQNDFLCGLPNLVALKIENIDARQHRARYMDTGNMFDIPFIFKTLKVLKFGTIRLEAIGQTDFWYAMITGSLRVNVIRLPRIQCTQKWEAMGNSGHKNIQGQKYGCLISLIKNQREAFPAEKENWLKVVDLKNLDTVDVTGDDFPASFRSELVFLYSFAIHHCKPKDVRLRNMLSNYMPPAPINAQSRPFDVAVESIILGQNLPSLRPMPVLKKLSIPSVSAIVSQYWEQPDIVAWGSLETIRVNFDMGTYDVLAAEELVEFVMSTPGTDEACREFQVVYDRQLGNGKITSRTLDSTYITDALPNLRKLVLIRWNPVNKEFLRLWKGLPLLEEIVLEDCPSLGNVALIGETQAAPVFLTLRFLKKLTLGLDECPKLTDRAFRDVFCHMKLREFTIKSKQPIATITTAGIQALLEGEFAKSIQKFPFHTWAAQHIPTEDMPLLKAKFDALIY